MLHTETVRDRRGIGVWQPRLRFLSNLFATVGFAAASAIFVVLALLLLASWRGKVEGVLLIGACAATALWAALVAAQRYMAAELAPGALVLAELARDGAWLLFLLRLLWIGRFPLWLPLIAGGVWAAAMALAIGILWSQSIGELVQLGDVLIMAGLLLSVLALVLMEQLFRRTPSGAERSKITYLIVGLALIFVYDVYVYSQGVLFGGVDELTWTGRAYVMVLASPLIAVSARRHAGWSVQLYVSRNVTFYGAAVTAIGAYLIVMAAAAYGIRLYGGEWGAPAQLAFLAGAVALLSVSLLAPSVRRDLRVMLNRHFYRSRYDYRAEWLRFAETLAAPRDKDELHEAVIQAVAQIVDAPNGMLWTEDDSGEGYGTAKAWPAAPLPSLRVSGMEPCVAFVRRTKWIIDLDQHRVDPAAYDDIAMPSAWQGDVQPRLVVPLFLRDDLLGFVTLSGKGIRTSLNYEDHDLLKTVGSQIATYLKQDDIQRRLALSRQFEAYHRASAFMLHDLKNIVAQQTLVLRNAERHRGNLEFFDDAMATISNSVHRMNRILAQSTQCDAREPRRVLLWEVLQQSVQACAHHQPNPTVAVTDRTIHVRCDPERLAGALEHLIRNAQQATSAAGCVKVAASSTDGKADVCIEDDGIGMDAEFIRSRLFSPFDSTKGSGEGMGIGAFQAREYIVAMGGKLHIESEPGKGTLCRIELPVA